MFSQLQFTTQTTAFPLAGAPVSVPACVQPRQPRRSYNHDALANHYGFGPVERKPVRTKAQQKEIPSERQPVKKNAQQNEKPNLNRFTIDLVLKQSLLRLLTLPLRHNNNGKKNSQISVAPYGNNFTGAGTGYGVCL